MRLLTRYLAREIYLSIGLSFLVLEAVNFSMALIVELADVGIGDYGLWEAFQFVTLQIPTHIYEMFPLATLIGTIVALVQMASSSELTIYRCSGASLKQMVRSLFRIGLPLVLTCLLFGEVVAPASEHLAQRTRFKALNSNVTLKEFRSGVWAKDEHSFINVRSVMPDNSLLGVSIYEFDEAFNLKAISHAGRAVMLGQDAWQLHSVQQTSFVERGASVREWDTQEWRTALSPTIFNVLLTLPEKMSALDLFQYVRHLEENRQATGRYEIAMWNKIVYPLAIWLMMLFALPFASMQRRQGGVGGKVFIGIVVGLAYHFIGRLFSSLGALNDWSPVLSATAISWLFLMLTMAMLWRVERR